LAKKKLHDLHAKRADSVAEAASPLIVLVICFFLR